MSNRSPFGPSSDDGQDAILAFNDRDLQLQAQAPSHPSFLNNPPTAFRASPRKLAGPPALLHPPPQPSTPSPTSPPKMRPTLSLLQKASSHPHTPLIKFLGKRSFPKPPQTDPPPHVHPASPSPSLPDSFAAYRSKAQQHGPLAGHSRTSTAPPTNDRVQNGIFYGAIGGHTGHELGRVEPDAKSGEVFDRSELPERFRRMGWTEGEIEAVGSGGASVW